MTAYSEWYDKPGGYTPQFIDMLYKNDPEYNTMIKSEATKAVQAMSRNPSFSYEISDEVLKKLPTVPIGGLLGGNVDETAMNRFEFWVVNTIQLMRNH